MFRQLRWKLLGDCAWALSVQQATMSPAASGIFQDADLDPYVIAILSQGSRHGYDADRHSTGGRAALQRIWTTLRIFSKRDANGEARSG
jgi:hypothetical protein